MIENAQTYYTTFHWINCLIYDSHLQNLSFEGVGLTRSMWSEECNLNVPFINILDFFLHVRMYSIDHLLNWLKNKCVSSNMTSTMESWSRLWLLQVIKLLKKNIYKHAPSVLVTWTTAVPKKNICKETRISWFWRWLLLRLSKRQSMSTTTWLYSQQSNSIKQPSVTWPSVKGSPSVEQSLHQNSWKLLPILSLSLTSIKWSPLLSRHVHHLNFPISQIYCTVYFNEVINVFNLVNNKEQA